MMKVATQGGVKLNHIVLSWFPLFLVVRPYNPPGIIRTPKPHTGLGTGLNRCNKMDSDTPHLADVD